MINERLPMTLVVCLFGLGKLVCQVGLGADLGNGRISRQAANKWIVSGASV